MLNTSAVLLHWEWELLGMPSGRKDNYHIQAIELRRLGMEQNPVSLTVNPPQSNYILTGLGQWMSVVTCFCVWVGACVCVCWRICVRGCVFVHCVCVCACVCGYMSSVHVYMHVCVCAHMHMCVRARVFVCRCG